jgi:magnesium transporter
MIKESKNKKITWVDIENPSMDELRKIMEKYNLDPAMTKEMALTTFKERVISKDGKIYAVFHFPALRHSHGDGVKQEIDFVIGKDFIITNRYEHIDAIESFSKFFEVNATLEKEIMEDHGGFVMYYILKELYKSVSNELDSINDELSFVEKGIFDGQEKEMVSSISKLSRDLLNIQHTIIGHGDILEKIISMGDQYLEDESFIYDIRKIKNESDRVNRYLTDSMDFLSELRETNNSLLSTKQNEIMKTLTILAFVVLPFSIITGFFQMNTVNTPFVGSENDWYIVILVELIIVISLFIFARLKKWL